MDPDDVRNALPAGFQIGNYRLRKVLRVGGFGTTYLSGHAEFRKQYTIKEWLPNGLCVRDGTSVRPMRRPHETAFEWGLARFFQKAETLARIPHRNVVRVTDFFRASRRPSPPACVQHGA